MSKDDAAENPPVTEPTGSPVIIEAIAIAAGAGLAKVETEKRAGSTR